MQKPWQLPHEKFEFALNAVYQREADFVNTDEARPEFWSGPKMPEGHMAPPEGEDGWAPDDNGRWFGPMEYFAPNWQVLQSGPVTPSPHPPTMYHVFCAPDAQILERALKAGYVPAEKAGWTKVT